MVNKRFNRKFRRALGAVLGAISVASISNIETIGAAFTESTLAGNAQIGWLFTLTKNQKKRIIEKIEHDLLPKLEKANPESGILRNINFGIPLLNGTSLSYPEIYEGFGNWDRAYTVTLANPGHESVRVTIIKTKSNLDNAMDPADYLLTPPMSKTEFLTYIGTHDVPWKGNWIDKNQARGAVNTAYLKDMGNVDVPNPSFSQRGNYIGKRGYVGGVPTVLDQANAPLAPPPPLPPGGGVPLPPPPLVVPPPGWADAGYLTRWEMQGLMDLSIWNKILGDDANIYKMYYDIKTCPPELLSFYYPEEKKEDNTFISNSSPAPVPAPSTMNMAPAMAALGVIPATIALANQSAPTPAHVVANNNVTQGSNNAGAAPAAQNGSVSSGSADIGTASQTGSDVKPTSVQHDAKSEAHSNEPLKT